MSGVPAMHHIVRHRVDDCTIVVIVSGGKGDRKKTAYGAPRAARCSQREPPKIWKAAPCNLGGGKGKVGMKEKPISSEVY